MDLFKKIHDLKRASHPLPPTPALFFLKQVAPCLLVAVEPDILQSRVIKCLQKLHKLESYSCLLMNFSRVGGLGHLVHGPLEMDYCESSKTLPLGYFHYIETCV